MMCLEFRDLVLEKKKKKQKEKLNLLLFLFLVLSLDYFNGVWVVNWLFEVLL